MSEVNDGGQAFPMLGNVGYKSEWLTEDGMSLRDYFAGQALAGVLANPTLEQHDKTISGAEAVAIGAYDIADAMLAERNKDAQSTKAEG